MLTAGPLDRELRSSYALTLVADDLVNPMARLQIRVEVLDVNDNRPKFGRRTYEAHVDERATLGETVIAVTAVDADSGAFGLLTYALETGDNGIGAGGESGGTGTDGQAGQSFPFEVNATSGVISVVGPLDRETRAEYRFSVRASDSTMSGTARLIVRIIDFNDNAPSIRVITDNAATTWSTGNGLDNWKSVEIDEEASPGEFVVHYSVKDPDAGINGRVKCSLTTRDDSDRYFRLKRLYAGEYQLVTAVKLDRELRRVHLVTLKCIDQAKPAHNRLTSESQLEVKVRDVNDNSPVFQESEVKVSVYENSPIG